MFYLISTKRGLGVELWGTFSDLKMLHEAVGKFWNTDDTTARRGGENKDALISAFSYEIRKAYEGQREKRKSGHFSLESEIHFGTHLSWVHILFSLSALRANMRFVGASKLDLAAFLQLEYWLEDAADSYDAVIARKLKPYINGALYQDNPYAYQFMRNINADYLTLGGGKQAFRKLPELLTAGVYFTEEYKDLLAFFTREAKRLGCEIDDLEVNDDHIEYETLKW